MKRLFLKENRLPRMQLTKEASRQVQPHFYLCTVNCSNQKRTIRHHRRVQQNANKNPLMYARRSIRVNEAKNCCRPLFHVRATENGTCRRRPENKDYPPCPWVNQRPLWWILLPLVLRGSANKHTSFHSGCTARTGFSTFQKCTCTAEAAPDLNWNISRKM